MMGKYKEEAVELVHDVVAGITFGRIGKSW